MIDRRVDWLFIRTETLAVAAAFKLSDAKRSALVAAVIARSSAWERLSTLEARIDVRSSIRTLAAL